MKTYISIVHWLPRIIGILAIMFISIFAADAFSPELTLWQQVRAFFMHLIPSFVLIALLLLAWKWEFAGGLFFVVVALGISPMLFSHNYAMNGSIWMSLGVLLAMTFPFVVVGILFIVSYSLKKRYPAEVST